ncbi:MAG: hypothetical protein JW816_00500 [Candidatus Buchananbacteria bacterium]|nr:hypothetical protein [Candidatus Buchananbacteria bacterium]
MPNSMEKIIELVKKTGDTHVIVDPNGEPAYVVLNFKAYERLVDSQPELTGLTEQELLEKINRDVSSWKDTQPDDDKIGDWQSINSVIQETKVDENGQFDKQKKSSETVAENQEKVVNQAKNSQDKDQYYFEPIE